MRVSIVRILFCLFAEDTGVFDPNSFAQFLLNRTREDGSDLGAQLNRLFSVLNTAEAKRQANLDEELAVFPYINGALFEEPLSFAEFDGQLRTLLLDCTRFDWSRISPGVFGSLFQSIMSGTDRREQGAHYTSEADILKVIRPLFLDSLKAELEAIKQDKARRQVKLEAYHQKLINLKLMDPACGCGNFLVVAYRELRLLELEVLKLKHGKQTELSLEDVNQLSKVNVDQMYGIELYEWPARIAEVALWLMDHQMNLEVSEAFHQRYVRIPLKASPNIMNCNALRIDWKKVIPTTECSYILGNPPFRGKTYRNDQQKEDMKFVFDDHSNLGDIDYVVSWFSKAANYIQGTSIEVGFVSTNSITQGEQVPIVWGLLLQKLKIKLNFAYRTFPWQSDARGKANVHVVIIGFSCKARPEKRLFDYDWSTGKTTELFANSISPYLTAGPETFVTKASKPLVQGLPEMRIGNKPTDDGNFVFSPEEKETFLTKEPEAKYLFRRYLGSRELINNIERWCLWLNDAKPEELRKLREVMKRVDAVREFRKKSSAEPTKKSAAHPTRFFFVSQPKSTYIAIPEASSEKRQYLPIGILPENYISSNQIYLIPTDDLFVFGIMSSQMHMAWMKTVGGRLKSDYRYSGSMVYNTFPWPKDYSKNMCEEVIKRAKEMLGARENHKKASLADLYDPRTMPKDVHRAHLALDGAVDKCYRKDAFGSERERVEFLFGEYQKLVNPLGVETTPRKHEPKKIKAKS